MTSRLAIMMGGRIAEEMIFGTDKVTSGAQSDIEQATRLARMMVTRWGFSPELGTVAYGENQEEVFLGHSVSRNAEYFGETAQKIDARSAPSGGGGPSEARRILTETRADLEALAKGLLEYETLSGDEIKDLLDGKPPVREGVPSPSTPRASAVPSTSSVRAPTRALGRWNPNRRPDFEQGSTANTDCRTPAGLAGVLFLKSSNAGSKMT